MQQVDIQNYKNIVILTGAGVSAASGLQTYRGKGGVWDKYDVETFGHVDTLQEHPDKVWQLYGGLREEVLAASHNPAHEALAKLEAKLSTEQSFTLITQNVDGFHQQAGSKNVVELHGTIHYTTCSNNDCTLERFKDENSHVNTLPVCKVCNSPLRPDIVLFGELLPVQAEWQCKKALRDCDLFIAVGTSGTVSPASNFVRSAEYAGARTIYVNLEAMRPRNPAFKEEYLGDAGDVLAELLGV